MKDSGLVRGLGPWDAALVTIGSVLGTGIFITTGRGPHLRGAGRAFPARGGAVRLPEGSLRALVGLPVRLGGLHGDPGRRHRDPRGGLRRVPGRVPSLLLHPARAPRGRGLERERGPARGGARHRLPDRGQLRGAPGGGRAAEPGHDRQDRLPRGAGRVRPRGSRPAPATALRLPDGRPHPRRLRGGDDRGPLELRRLVRPHEPGGGDAAAGARPADRPHHGYPRGDPAVRAHEPRLRTRPDRGTDGREPTDRRGVGRPPLRSRGGAHHHRGRPRLHLRVHLLDHPLRRPHLPPDGRGRGLFSGPREGPPPLPHAVREHPRPPPSSSCAAPGPTPPGPTGPGATRWCPRSSSSRRSLSW